jgi:hypothetical protein
MPTCVHFIGLGVLRPKEPIGATLRRLLRIARKRDRKAGR